MPIVERYEKINKVRRVNSEKPKDEVYDVVLKHFEDDDDMPDLEN